MSCWVDHGLLSMSQSIRSHPDWSRLVDLVRELAFIDGGSDDAFTLASGKKSRWFFDTKPVMMHPEASHIIGELLNIRMDELGADFVGGLELGAVPLTAIAVTMSPKNSARRGFMVRKEPKGRGGRKTNNPPGIEGSSLAAGGKIVIVEDVTTTGGSAIRSPFTGTYASSPGPSAPGTGTRYSDFALWTRIDLQSAPVGWARRAHLRSFAASSKRR